MKRLQKPNSSHVKTVIYMTEFEIPVMKLKQTKEMPERQNSMSSGRKLMNRRFYQDYIKRQANRNARAEELNKQDEEMHQGKHEKYKVDSWKTEGVSIKRET